MRAREHDPPCWSRWASAVVERRRCLRGLRCRWSGAGRRRAERTRSICDEADLVRRVVTRRRHERAGPTLTRTPRPCGRDATATRQPRVTSRARAPSAGPPHATGAPRSCGSSETVANSSALTTSSVELGDEGDEVQSPARLHVVERADRRLAAALERGQHSRSHAVASRVGGSSSRATRSRTRWSSARTWTASAPCPGAGNMTSRPSTSRDRGASPRRSARRARAASRRRSPDATFSIRVGTLPRMSTMRDRDGAPAPGRAAGCDDVPTRAPAGSDASVAPPRCDEHVPRILARENGAEREPRGHVGRQVLQAMHGDVNRRRRGARPRCRS